MALLDFRKSAMKGGEIDPKAAQTWVDKAGKLLKRYDIDIPDIKSALVMADDAAKTSREFQNSALGNVLGKDPEKAIGSIFSGERALSSREVMGEIVDLLKKTKGDKAATEGLKNSFKKFIFEESMTPQGETLTFDNIYKNMKKFEPAMKMLYKPEELKSMRTARKALDIMRRGQDASGGGGGAAAEEEAIGIIPSFLRILGLKGRFAAKLLDTLGKNKNSAEKFLVKAINDPEYADLLISQARAEGAKNLINPLNYQPGVVTPVKTLGMQGLYPDQSRALTDRFGSAVNSMFGLDYNQRTP
jgi:hypothetical protein